VTGYRIPDDAIAPRCDCPECVELGRCIDATLRARLAETIAAAKVDRKHALNSARVLARPASGDRTPERTVTR